MPKVPLDEVTIQYNGLFDFDALYAAIIDWCKNYGYKWHERDFKHKVPLPTGAEQEMKWLVEKNVTEYVKYTLLFTVHLWDMLDVEVDVGGNKKVLTNSRIYIKIMGTIEFDWQKKFSGSKFAQYLGVKYFKWKAKDLESTYMDGLWYRMWNVHALIKEFFDMQTKQYAYKGYLGED
jgi:hypothetical protein